MERKTPLSLKTNVFKKPKVMATPTPPTQPPGNHLEEIMDQGDKLEFLVENPSDVWSRPHGQDIYVFDSDEDDALWAVMRFSQPVDGKYLFDLS